MIKHELTAEINKTFGAMEKTDITLEEIRKYLTPEQYTTLWVRYQDLCDSVYRVSIQAHRLERYEFVDEFKKPLKELFPRCSRTLK